MPDETVGNGSTSLVTTDAATILHDVVTFFEDHVGEPLFPGDERRIFAEGIALLLTSVYNSIDDAAQQVMLRFARGEVLDALGARLGVIRIAGEPAQVMLRFTISMVRETSVTIPKWTKVTPDGEVYFATDEDAIIAAGESTVDVMASCTASGEMGNGFGPGSITTMVDLIPYVSSVTNTSTSSGGDNGEPYDTEGDDRFRERIRIAPGRLSTAGPEASYIYWTKTADADIVDVAAFSDIETVKAQYPVTDGKVYIGGDLIVPDSGVTVNGHAPQEYTYKDSLLVITLSEDDAREENVDVEYVHKMDGRVKIVPLMEGGKAPDENTIKAIYETVNAKDVRPMTDVVTVVAPVMVDYDIEIDYYALPDDEAEVVKNVEGKTGAIAAYVSEQSSVLGRDINPDVLKTFVMHPDDGASKGAIRCDVTKPEYTVVPDTAVAHFSGNLTARFHSETGARW